MLIDLLRSDGSIVVNKNLIHSIGLNASIMYSELASKRAYFEERGQLTEDGYFYNTVDNMRLDTGLGEKPQKTAIEKLERLGLIKMENRGMPSTRHFKLIENNDLLMSILSEGKQERAELKDELEAKSKKKKGSLSQSHQQFHQKGGTTTAQKEELVPPNGRINNTKSNNPKKNNNIYIISEETDACVFKYYSKRYKDQFGKEHPTMNHDKMEYLRNQCSDITIDLDIDDETWLSLVDYHFDNLPTKNNGNILAFLDQGVIYRYLEETADEEWINDDSEDVDLDRLFPD